VRLLALTAAQPDVPFEAVTIGRGADAGSVAIARIPQLGGSPEVRAATALAQLAPLAALRADGLRAPLPVPCGTAHAYAAAALQTGEDPIAAANRVWESRFGYEGEEIEPEHRLALGPELDLDRLGALATAIWRPLLAREVIES
jgi:exodeoxyribonuclease V gamma subunit